ncbi:hypothetical protein V7164_03550 [Bacillus sp. JJ1474]
MMYVKCHTVVKDVFVGKSEEWSRLLTEDVLQVNHQHVIFTIDEGLLYIFAAPSTFVKEINGCSFKIYYGLFQKKVK